MNLQKLLRDENFNMLFSFLLGLGIICIIRPVCKGAECSTIKPPVDKDFDKYVYRMGDGKCYEFKTEMVSCPSSGVIEGFRERIGYPSYHNNYNTNYNKAHGQFVTRSSSAS